MSKHSPGGAEKFWKGFWPSMALLAGILAVLFRASFKSDYAQFSNDGPLGVMNSQALHIPEALTGYWVDLNWVGMNGGAASSSVSYLLIWILGPVGFAKFYPALTLLLLGASAWIFFRTLKLSPGLCCVAMLGAALNMNFFSNTCWGLGTRSLTLMSAFLALAALNTRRAGNPWVNAALAGLAVGLGVVEGADNGAIFSLFIAAYVVWQSIVEESTWPRRFVSALRLGVVGLCAMFLAAQVLITLTGIAAKTARGARIQTAVTPPTPEQQAAENEKQWVFATQWSLPPKEGLLRLIIPGIYGYRMDTPDGGQYWGRVGEYWPLPEGPQRRSTRSSGAGEYAGVLVVLVGLWALFHALAGRRGASGVFDSRERLLVLFWAAMLVPALLFSWGYHAPFYKLVYSLPYFSTIRNPMKFMHPGHMTLMILFGYGLLGLSRRYLEAAPSSVPSFGERFRQWKSRALPVEKWWFRTCLLFSIAGVLGFLVYSNARGSLVRHLQEIGFPDESQATAIASFSSGEVGRFVVCLLASVALVILIQIGTFAGKRSRWAALCLGVLLTLDLVRSDLPWIKPYDYGVQYASNPVIELLRKEPWLHRTAAFPDGLLTNLPQAPAQQITIAHNITGRGPWLQWHYPYYNIQSLDLPQDPRPPAEKTNYLAHVSRSSTRLWELTNTRYLIGLAGPFADALNQVLDPARRSFREVLPFKFTQGEGFNIGAESSPNGPWAVVEYGAALPRAMLFADWQTIDDAEKTLDILGNPSFDPHKVLLVNEAVPLDPGKPASLPELVPPPPAANSNAAPGTVEFSSYAPKHIELKATATVPSVLLLNDQFDRDWFVTVDGKPESLLRCNYLMRGVKVSPGQHQIVFHFQPSLTGMKVTLAAFATALLLCGFLVVSKPRFPEPPSTSPPPKKV